MKTNLKQVAGINNTEMEQQDVERFRKTDTERDVDLDRNNCSLKDI